ncbi:MAG: methylated-DNA--[protein]-cysteine S-methyltransferase [Methylococcales bacterium]
MWDPIRTIPEQCAYNLAPSPFGQLAVVVSDLGVHAICWPNAREDQKTDDWLSRLDRSGDHPVYKRAAAQLQEYFSGTRKIFDIPLVLNGTRFQNSVWNGLREIPYGRTLSYEEQAIRLGGKEKVRAVGRANGMNPIPILIPCHRVIGKNGSLTGFGGGLAIKALLLDLESNRPRQSLYAT